MKKREENTELKEFSIYDFVTPTSITRKVDQSTFNDVQHKSYPPIVPTYTAEPTVTNESSKRTSSKQRKESLGEYRELFLRAPKIIDRQPIFISRELRDKIDDVVRKIGERKMSVSGFAENVLRHHLDTYNEEVERWKRL